MLVQDWSCSMNFGGYPRPIDISRRATWGFLDYMVTHPQDGDMFGITGYAEFGVGPDVGSAAGAVSVPTGPPWADLSIIDAPGMWLYLKLRVSRICDSENGCPVDGSTESALAAKGLAGPDRDIIGGCTNPSIAMNQATDQLVKKTDTTYFRGMLVMSDGVFNCTLSGGDPAQDAVDAANDAYDNHDIHIWTILYHAGSFDAAQLAGLTRGLGFAQASNDVADLPAMYATVAEALPTAIVD